MSVAIQPGAMALTRMLRARHLVRERAREAEDRRLGGGIGHAAGPAEGAHHARHVDDCSPTSAGS